MYGEEARFEAVAGKAGLVAYHQRTWSLGDVARPMHSESGYLRLPSSQASAPEHGEDEGSCRVELLVCDPTGVAQGEAPLHNMPHPLKHGSLLLSVYEGRVDQARQRLDLTTTHVVRTSSAKDVRALRRTYQLLSAHDGPPPRLHYGKGSPSPLNSPADDGTLCSTPHL